MKQRNELARAAVEQAAMVQAQAGTDLNAQTHHDLENMRNMIVQGFKQNLA